MATKQQTLFPPRSVPEFIQELDFLKEEIKQLYCESQVPIVIGYSGGKDSSAVVQLFWYAISELPKEKLHKPIHIISTDTLVENPVVSAWVKTSLNRINEAAKQQNLPIQSHLLTPEADKTYWVGLIGKGYPIPKHTFRWCTPRLKVDPSNKFIRNIVRNNGEAIVTLGTRKTESQNRAAIMEERDKKKLRDRLCPHPHLPSSLLYTPIETWQTDEVWMYLMQWENPWGHSNKELFNLYRGSTADNECPLVIDTSTPSCGNSRFGCWVCTLVNSDKSMEAMIQNDEQKEWLQPLIDFRLELDIKNDRHKRDFRRIYGRVELFERNRDGEVSVEPIPGPYVKKWREHWLRRVLEAQQEVRQTAPEDMRDITLITTEELSEIRRIWLEEKHEFDDSLPKIYQDVTGEPFKDPRPGADQSLLGSDEWNTLEDICQDDPMHLELMARLLDTERQFFTKSRRSGIFGSLEKCFDTSSRSKEEAIKNAHYKRDLQIASQNADVQKIRELTASDPTPTPQSWADIKFGQAPKSSDHQSP
ncbi:DNA phosphorothioation system sulfurtransferase DndC [Spirulina sp. CS-785/01]|uniref:DNA phosphorothioation system sulfurtransferase DndC n=1 Tax=Spirulina sp. CS-785/01 TaxID=3021716 RepID=UPI00232F1BD9|nr:DNA phosphorothioation system sulfurtransferase DndC [Spirulina sp. CS-785/01]MDB9313589.1 DNA phosphorothioation system sulfurtransferase DndC [Spirulina sp. CS-785/01]